MRMPDVPPVSFVALIPLESILQFGGLQMMAYLGVRLGDLLIVTLCKFVVARVCTSYCSDSLTAL